MSEVSDAIQVVVVSGRAMYKAGSISVKAIVAMIKLLNTIYLSKWKGKASLGYLRQNKGDDMVFVNIASEDRRVLKAFEKEMKAHGILYARMPDLCGGDGRTQYAIGASDISKVKPLLLDHAVGRYRGISAGLISEQEYLGSGIMPDGNASPELSALYGSANVNGAGRTEERMPGMNPSASRNAAGQAGYPDAGRSQRNRPVPEENVPAQSLNRQPVRAEGNADILKIHELAAAGREDEYLFVNHHPLLREETFAVYAMPDGFTGIVVEQPKEYKIPGHQAVIFADRQYHTVNFETGRISRINGNQVIPVMKGESLRERNSYLKSLVKDKRTHLTQAITTKLAEKVR